MSVPFTRQRIRLQLDCNFAEIVDRLTGATPRFYNGTDLAFELGVFFGGELVDVSGYASITLEVKVDSNPATVPLMTKTVAAVDLNAALTADDWTNNVDQHALVPFTYGETVLDLSSQPTKTLWIAISAVTTDTPERRVTLAAGSIIVVEDGTPTTSLGPVQGGNIINGGATYNGSGNYVQSVTAAKTYGATLGNATTITNGGSTISADGNFVTQGTTITLHGPPSTPVTTVLRSVVYLTADELDGRYADAADMALKLAKASNLSDVASVATSRTNLDVYSKSETDTADALKLAKASNLSDLANAATSRTNLDVYSKAQVDTADALKLAKASNLSDLASAATSRTNLDVYSKSETDTIGNLKLAKASNLSDLASAATARTNLGVYSTTSVDTLLGLRLLASNNLSDVSSPSTALANLGGFPTTGGAITGASSVKAAATPLTVWLDSTGTLGGVLETVKVQRRSASGLPTAGFGAQLNFALDTTTTLRTAANINCFWANPTDANRTAYVQFTNRVLVSGVYGEAEVLGLSDAGNVCIGFGYPATETSGMSYGLVFGASIPPGANPSNAFALFYENTGHTFRYRGDTANEGAGANNYLHNRAISATPGAGLYTLTTSFAQVDFGSGVKMSVALPTAGTYLIMAQVCFVGGGTAGDAMEAQLHDDTGAAYLGFPIRWQPYTTGAPQGASPLLAVATVTGASTISVYAKNATAARGTVIPTYCNLVAVRLY